ncbi:transporter [Chitinimonas sp.]|uniref:transporter n=1 Tax=Chitinimonas sp. TaxID=1934313 RepID=UPI0035B3CC7B
MHKSHALAILLISLQLPAVSQAADFAITTGLVRNIFHDPYARELNVPIDLNIEHGRWTFDFIDTYYSRSASAPRASAKPDKPQSGERAVRIGNKVIWIPKPKKPKRGIPAREGWGDLTVNSAYNLVAANASRPFFDVTGGLTLPTGDMAKGFSTGATEGSIGFNVGMAHQQLSYSASIQRNFNGQVKGEQTQDTWSSDLTLIYNLGGGFTVGAAYDYAQATNRRATSSRQFSLLSSYELTPLDKVNLNFGHGFGSADATQTLTLSYTHFF